MLCEDVVATLAIVCDRDRRSLDDGGCVIDGVWGNMFWGLKQNGSTIELSISTTR